MILRNLLFFVFKLFPINSCKILFISHLGKNYSCNPKYLCEYILKHNSGKYKLIYLYDPINCNPQIIPKGIKAVSIYSKRFIFELSTCGWLVSNTRIPEWFNFIPRNKQHYIQTWHSSLRLKKIEKDANLDDQYREFAKNDSTKISIIISGCRFSSIIFSKSFWFNGPILEVGTPRIDYLLNVTADDKQKLYRKSVLDPNFHYVLYAPTFRNSADISVYNIDYEYLVTNLEKKFGGTWKILFRIHPNLKDIIKVSDLTNNCIDVSNYDDIQELLLISDILITDYSSCMFDVAFLNKLCILYASDVVNYYNNERQFYFDINKLPFPLATNNKELGQVIENYDSSVYKNKVLSFIESIGSFEIGKACERIFEYIQKNTI